MELFCRLLIRVLKRNICGGNDIRRFRWREGNKGVEEKMAKTRHKKRWTLVSTNQKDNRSKIKGVVNVLGEE